MFWPADKPFINLVRITHPTKTKLEEKGVVVLGDKLFLECGEGAKLTAILVGNAARSAIEKKDEDVLAAVLKLMRMCMWPSASGAENITERCTSVVVTRWEEDVHSLGAFSCFSLATKDRFIDDLAESCGAGRLLFAGEATDGEFQGSVHGAIRSGVRCAEQCL